MPIPEPAPRPVPPVRTKYRRIVTEIPVPESIPVLQKLRQFEPVSMSGQPPVVWDRAAGIQVYDRWGNMWLDWSSGVLVTNAGHNHPRVRQAILDQVDHGLVHNYCFPSEIRAQLVEQLAAVAPEGLKKVFLLSTGAEACECAIKLARTWGRKLAGNRKITIVTFHHAFHGRTLGAQTAGGIPALKQWIVNLDKDFVQVPFPDGFRGPDTSFEGFLQALGAQGVEPEMVAGVMMETYQGGNASFAPPEYIQQLRAWCDQHQALLMFDEVQAGFGRTGTFWGFEHYGVASDLFCCGKGISSGLPISAVIGRPEIMDLYPPGSMTSTHTGNPVCAAAALASIRVVLDEGLVEHARRMGEILQPELRRIGQRFCRRIGAVHGRGLVASLHMIKPEGKGDKSNLPERPEGCCAQIGEGKGDKSNLPERPEGCCAQIGLVPFSGIEPDAALAAEVVRRCVEKGLLMFAPVGYGGASVKIAPPLVIDEEPLRESLAVLEEALTELLP